MREKFNISLDEMMVAIRQKVTGKFDKVVAIGRGGIVAGAIISRYLDIPLDIIYLKYRDDFQKIDRAEPELQNRIDFQRSGCSILIVDDVSRTGATMKKAIEIFPEQKLQHVLLWEKQISLLWEMSTLASYGHGISFLKSEKFNIGCLSARFLRQNLESIEIHHSLFFR